MDRIDVKEHVKEIDMTVEMPSELRWAKWNAENAFNRMTVCRETRKALVDGINDNVDSMPKRTRKVYDKIIDLMKVAESYEIDSIKYGE